MLGRNDPCHCGSGKKYKKCCWTKDRAAQNVVRDESIDEDEWNDPVDEADNEPSLRFAAKDEPAAAPSVEEPDPLIERMNEFWEEFEDASYAEQWVLVEEMLANEPEIIDSEIVFETTNSLFSQAMDAGESDRFIKLLDQFEAAAPQAYQEEMGYILDWRINIALQQGDKAAVAAYFSAFAPIAGDKLDIYYRVISMLAYHGELDVLYAGLWQARPFVEESGELVPWAYAEFVEELADIEVLYLISNNPELAADDPTLQQHFTVIEITLIPDVFNRMLTYRTGRLTPAWVLSDFDFEPSEEDDPAKQKLTYLLMAFTHFAHTQGVSLTKAEMVRKDLYQYFAMRIDGDLGEYGRRPQKRRRRKKRKTKPHPLCPDAKSFDAYFSKLVGFMAFKHYEACALFELLPMWLQFLCEYNLLDEETRAQTLQNLSYLKELLINIAQVHTSDSFVVQNLADWPNV